MFKVIVSEVIPPGMTEEDKAFREKSQKLFEKYGIGPRKMWRVEGRKSGQLFIEFEFESRAEFEASIGKIYADKEFQDLSRERRELGALVEGSQEFFILTEY